MAMQPNLGECVFEAVEILFKSGFPRPGTGGKDIGYIVKLNAEGTVVGVDIAISDNFLGKLLDRLN